MQSFGACEKVIDMTLTLFRDLTVGYMSSKLLSKLDAINFILTHHSPQYYSFLQTCANARNRTIFYSTIARMIFMEDSSVKFRTFTVPLQQIFDGIHAASAGATSAAQLRQNVPAATVTGLFRDLMGISAATMCRRAYSMLFEWLYPAHFPVIVLCLQAWADTPAVTTPLLKFMLEFVSNKGQCLTFESSSPNGILLFREISKVLVTYSTAILQVRAPLFAGFFGTIENRIENAPCAHLNTLCNSKPAKQTRHYSAHKATAAQTQMRTSSMC